MKLEIRDSLGTLKSSRNFDAKAEASKLNKAMKGFGTDEDVMIQFLGLPSRQKSVVSECYLQMFGKNLYDQIKSELSGDFRNLALALLKSPVDLACDAILAATKKSGTSGLVLLIAVLLSRSNEERNEIIKMHDSQNKKTLQKYVETKTSGIVRTFISELLEKGMVELSEYEKTDYVYNNKIDALINRDSSKRKVQRMRELFTTNQPIVDTSLFNEVFLQQNRFQAADCIMSYQKLTGKTVLNSATSKMNETDKLLLENLINWIVHPVGYFANCLQVAFKGIGTDENLLNFIIADRCEKDLANIDANYKATTGKSLQSLIKSETSGDYRKLLLNILP